MNSDESFPVRQTQVRMLIVVNNDELREKSHIEKGVRVSSIKKIFKFAVKENRDMETILLRGDSKANSKLLLKLAKQLNFSARKLSPMEIEELGIEISINEGIKSGILSENEKQDFLAALKQG